MQSDLPHTLYYDRKKRRKGKKAKADDNYKYNPNDKAIRMQEEAIRRMRERRVENGGEVRYTVDELFRK